MNSLDRGSGLITYRSASLEKSRFISLRVDPDYIHDQRCPVRNNVAFDLMLILASASPRRLDLLRQIGVEPDLVVPAELDESELAGELPRTHARRLAEAKAAHVAAAHPGACVLGADTVVACGRRILGKAEDEAEARRYLALLSGRRHRVYGGICLIAPSSRPVSRVVQTSVAFKRLSKQEIADYISHQEWRGKAGAYAIQGRAGAFVRQLRGSYSNVVGLPLFETHGLLSGLGMANS